MTNINFRGKEFVFNHHLSIPFHTLEPQPDLGVGEPSIEGNLIIHGDNLLALKALLPLYANSIDCIFIDPPYNTGNENWCYNDNVNSPAIRDWLESGPIGADDGLRHDKWCAMMWPRLKLLRELLSDRGSIWITLDGNEVHRAKLICDEIFGIGHCLGTLVWEKSDSPKMDADTFSSSHDYILVYSKSKESYIFERLQQTSEDIPEHYNKTDEQGRTYYTKPLRAMGFEDTREDRPTMYFSLTSPDGTEIFPVRSDGVDGRWRWSLERIQADADRIEWVDGRNGWNPYYKIYADTSKGRPPETIWYHADVGSSRKAKAEIKEIFGSDVFPTPKPVKLVQRVLEIASETDSTILDSFAGSGTTGQAVLEMNNLDSGSRKFIMVEMEEYANELTAERIRRVIERHEESGLTGRNFTYCELGQPVDTEGILSGENLPSYEQLGRYFFNIVTYQILDNDNIDEANFYLGETSSYHVWMLYQNDLDWLKSSEAALTLARAREFAEHDQEKRHLVIAPAKYVSQKMLEENNIPVEFVPLPYTLFSV